jgi:hypothetical protein
VLGGFFMRSRHGRRFIVSLSAVKVISMQHTTYHVDRGWVRVHRDCRILKECVGWFLKCVCIVVIGLLSLESVQPRSFPCSIPHNMLIGGG